MEELGLSQIEERGPDRVDASLLSCSGRRAPDRIVFTDLDGTLLDADDYSFGGARPALRALRETGAELVLVTSKTRREVEPIRRALDLSGPYVYENGSGIALPRDYPPEFLPEAEARGRARILCAGRPYTELRRFFRRRAQRFGIRGFGDATVGEVVALTGLDPISARRAQVREFTEPFTLEGPGRMADLRSEARAEGLEIVRGGRFHHLMSTGVDKGRAIERLLEGYRAWLGAAPRTLALGDAENDLPMFERVDCAVLFASEGLPSLASEVRIVRRCGPSSWSEEVLRFLRGTEPLHSGEEG